MSHLKANTARLSAPSPTPSNSSTGAAKRKRPADDGRPTVFSQPTDRGTGSHLSTQVTYSVDFLKQDSSKWFTSQQIFDYLNVQTQTAEEREKIHRQLVNVYRDPKFTQIEWNPKTDMFRYLPKLNIRSADDLMRYLQNQKSAQGLSVKDIRDGWPGVLDGVQELEAKNQILVAHHKKDDMPKTVWMNDASLMHDMDEEFKDRWVKTSLPANPDDLRKRLITAGLKPSSVPRDTGPSKPKEKKKKAPRRGGKQTNTHMANILKDFSHMRK